MLREMKALNIIWFPALLTLLSACVKEEIFPESKVVEGIPTEVTLSYSVDDAEIITRAAQESRYEYRVENMYIFIFDASGNRISLESGSSFFTLDAGLTVNNGNASSSGKVQFSVKSANDARIIGVANLTTSETSTAYNVSASDLDKINTLDELRNLVINARQESIERGGLFLMAGYAVAGNVQSDEDVSLSDERTKIDIVSEVKTHYITGVEMEALSAVSVAALTIYDMCKAIDRAMVIEKICLLEKKGGKSDYARL